MHFTKVRGNVVTTMNKSTKTLQIFLSSYRESRSMEHKTPFHVPQSVVLGSFRMQMKRKHLFGTQNDNVTVADHFNLVWISPDKQNSSNRG